MKAKRVLVVVLLAFVAASLGQLVLGSRDGQGSMVNVLWDAPEGEVLTIGEIEPHAWEEYGEIMGLHPCEECGEPASVAYLRVVGDKHVRIPCSAYGV